MQTMMKFLPPFKPAGYLLCIANSKQEVFFQAKMVCRGIASHQFAFLVRYALTTHEQFVAGPPPPVSEWENEIATSEEALKCTVRMFAQRFTVPYIVFLCPPPRTVSQRHVEKFGVHHHYVTSRSRGSYLTYNAADPNAHDEVKLREAVSVLSNLKAPSSGAFSWDEG